MKKTILLSVLAVLCLILSATAQENPYITPLKIGDQIPDVTINNLINYESTDGKPITSVKISQFKDKLLILDFWATWCSPCVAMIPKMDSLQQQFKEDIQFLPVTYQSAGEINAFLKRFGYQGNNLPEVTSDKVLSKIFPHTYLPHYVWIERGKVKYITGYTEVTAEKIKHVLSGNSLMMTEKSDATEIPYDPQRPLFLNGNGGNGEHTVYRSVLSAYIEGVPSSFQIATDEHDENKIKRITTTNLSLTGLFSIAFNENKRYLGTNRIVLEVKDSSNFTRPKSVNVLDWMKHNNVFSYELNVPDQLSDQAYQIMQQELMRCFPRYKATLEKRKKKILALTRTSADDKIRSTGGKPAFVADQRGMHIVNSPIAGLIGRLNVVYLQRSSLPIVDKTNYGGPVDLELNANLNSISSINEALVAYDLKLTEVEDNLEVLVIADKN